MEMITNVGKILGVLVSLAGLFKFVKEWILTPEEDQKKVLSKLKSWLNNGFFVLVTVMCFATSLVSIWQVYEFGVSEDPLTRKAVLSLIASLWNALVYLSFGVGIPVAMKVGRLREARRAAEAQA